MRLIPIIVLFFTISGMTLAQTEVPIFGNVVLLNGYVKFESGQSLSYNSAIPRVAKEALLTRCTDGRMTYSWYTAPTPDSVGTEYIYYAWLAAYSGGTSHKESLFDITINNDKSVTLQVFPQDERTHWFYGVDTGIAVVFKRMMLDKNKDVHGLMILRVPAKAVASGSPLLLSLTGQALNTPDWMMTFKYAFKDKVMVTPMPFLIKRDEKLYQTIFLEFDQVSAPEAITISIKDHLDLHHQVPTGYSNIEIPIPALTESRAMDVIIKRPRQVDQIINLQVEPVTPREIYFIHHSHHDLGYTHRQEEVIDIQIKNIRDALKLIEDTKLYPQDTRFKWTVENMWSVDHFFRQASKEEKNQFLTAVDQGNIALTGLYANVLTGLAKPEEMMRWTEYATWFAQEYKVEFPPTAMISDIPGLTGGAVAALAHKGVRYFSSGPNTSDRIGSSSKYWADRPFYWVTPSGQKMLYWLPGKGYSSWHGTSPGDIILEGKERIGNYLNQLQHQGYPYAMVQWRYAIGADNGGVDSTLSDFTSLWNQEYVSPKLWVGNIHELYKKFEERYGDQLPYYQGDLSPYWEDGAYSTAAETSTIRETAEKINWVQNCAPFLKPDLDLNPEVDQVWKNINYFNEHTWGAFNSISNPDGDLQKSSWDYKRGFVTSAANLTKTLEPTVFQDTIIKQADSLRVLNTAYRAIDGVVRLPGDFYRPQSTLTTSDSAIIPWQQLPDKSMLIFTDSIPAWTSRVIKWVPWDSMFVEINNEFTVTDNDYSNGLIKIKLSPKDGSIIKISAANKVLYQNSEDKNGLNTYWYVQGLGSTSAQAVSKVSTQVIERGPVRLVVRITSAAPGCRSLVREIMLKKNDPRIYITNILDKTPVRTKEAGYFNFPFEYKQPSVIYDSGWGPYRAEADQLPGSNRDFVSVSRWIDYSEHGRGFTLLTKQAALFTLGEVVDENTSGTGVKTWREYWSEWRGLTAYVFNNYWHTNYKADQEGPMSFEFVLVPHELFNSSQAYQEAQRWNTPLTYRYMPLESIYPAPITIDNPHILVSSVRRTGNSYQYRLFNASPARQEVYVTQPDQRKATIRFNGARQFGVNTALTLSIPGHGISELSLDFSK